MFQTRFCEIFKNIFFTEHLRVTAFEIRMQVVVIYNLNISLQFLTINFRPFCEFSRWIISQCRLIMPQKHRFVFRWGYFYPWQQGYFYGKIITKYNIQNTQVHTFRNRLLGEVAKALQLFLIFSNWTIIVLEPVLLSVHKLRLLKILLRKQVRNNYGLPILTLDLWRKTKQ